MKNVSLDQVKPGQECRVKDVYLSGEIKYRLLDMGIIPNTKIKLVKKAPLGDPIQILLRGYNLTIRKEIAKMIEVEVEE